MNCGFSRLGVIFNQREEGSDELEFFNFTNPVREGITAIDKEWRVYDLVIEDISVVNNYRSQFSRVIARSSFEELLRMLKAKPSAG